MLCLMLNSQLLFAFLSFFTLPFVLYVLLRITAFDHLFGIFKLLSNYILLSNSLQKLTCSFFAII